MWFQWAECIGAAVLGYAALTYYQCQEDKKLRWKLKNTVTAAAYLLLACITAGLFGIYGYGWTKIMRYEIFIYAVLLIAYIDWKERKIPNRLLIILLGIRIVLLAVEMAVYPSLISALLLHAAGGFLLLGGGFLLVYALARNSIGAGDVKLAAVMGCYFGAAVGYAIIVVALVLTAVYGISQLMWKKLKLKDTVAFAPFLAAGCVIVALLAI